ncbi:MAG: acyl--CoA ligase [Clostridiales bacterium]|nr:acyl--CoA ligase [Clostridiales bacterium]
MDKFTATGYPSIDKTHLKNVNKKLLKPTVLPLSIYGSFMLINSKRLHEPAIQEGERIYSKQEIHDDVLTLIKSFKVCSVKRGQTLAIVTPNIYEGIVMTVAANAMGVKVAYFNSLAMDEEIASDVEKYAPDILFLYDKDPKSVQKVYNKSSVKFSMVINYEPETTSRSNDPDVQNPGFRFISFDAFKKCGEESSKGVSFTILRNLFSKKVSLFLQTSGSSSGKPKVLPFTNECVFASMVYASNSSGTKTNDTSVNKAMCILPYRLPYGWTIMFIHLMGGNCVVLAPGASPEDIGNYYKYEPSYIYGTPVILRAFMDNTPANTDLSFLKAFFASGFSMSESLYAEAKDFFAKHNTPDIEIRNNYGIGEGLCIGTSSEGLPHREGTVGKLWYGPEWVIVDDDLNEVKYGEIGEVLVYSKTLCKGYLKEPELSKKTFIKFRGKRFYRSGDYMSLDVNGIVTFYGRRKRFYQPLGATDKVNCETIEKAICDCPIVKNCAVVVVPDEEKVQTGKAFVQLNDGVDAYDSAEKEIFEFISHKLLDYQLPKYYCFLDEIPLMKSGKIDYMKLEKM